ncbi:MAG TPA: 4-(cytidine 5'-diphospho)-2-C-methyl-D-erythritol kinase [Aridibacter sp.]|nr:4-(cytidine 5'-diphospho)-2-C-methyl-D-erythritol kinase [Aridibacter sp.]
MQNPSFRLPSFAKINWFLKVGGLREDGFHEVCTAFQTISLHDTLSFEPADTLVLESSHTGLPLDGRNLVYRAAEALRRQAGIRDGARIRIEKNIPFPGGLGGGSSNAAVALLGLARLWGISPTLEDLLEISSDLGSDVPFFLIGGTALGTGRGTDLEPLTDVGRKLLLIFTPEADYSTTEAYGSLGRDRLTSEGPETKLMVCRELAEELISGSIRPVNDFEEAVDRLAPVSGMARDGLLSSGASIACLSGSGPSVFGIFDNESRRQHAIERNSPEKDVRLTVAESISRAEYREALGPCGDLLPLHFS